MNHDREKTRWWKQIAALLVATFIFVCIAIAFVQTPSSEAYLSEIIHKLGLDNLPTLKRVKEQHENYSAVAGILAIWLTSPLTLMAGYIYIYGKNN